jgi:hypothetical protein
MDFPFNFFWRIWHTIFRALVISMPILIAGQLLGGCVTYQVIRSLEGTDVVAPGDELQEGKTTLEDTLALLGAPTTLVELEGQDLLLYQKTVMRQKRLSVGIPLLNAWGTSINFSASGGRVNYDTLALFFTPDRILRQVVFEEGTSQPYKKPISKDSY